MLGLTVLKLLGVSVLYLFLPLTAVTYYLFRRDRRMIEIRRILDVLKIKEKYQNAYEVESGGRYFVVAVVYASVVSFIGLALLFLGPHLDFSEFPSVSFGRDQFPQPGSRLVFGMAFLGAYMWGLQYVSRRYDLNDLVPAVYFHLSTRMIFAALIALVLYNVYAVLAGNAPSRAGSDPSTSAITSTASTIWPALAFLLGMFPQRGLRWLTDRLPVLAPETDPSVRSAPLEMIEGIESADVMRLEEVGIDTCYDLATADFVPLLLHTPYSARELVDWILQAKLCVYFGEVIKDLRRHSIRTVIDLKRLNDTDMQALAAEAAVTRFALEKAQKAISEDREIDRLVEIGRLVGSFSDLEMSPQPRFSR
jgi:hypothetical protein